MTVPQRFFANGKRAFEQRLGVGIALLPLIQRRQIVQHGGDLGESRPAVFSRIAMDRLNSGSASPSLPWLP